MSNPTVTQLLALTAAIMLSACSTSATQTDAVEPQPRPDRADRVIVFSDELNDYLSAAGDSTPAIRLQHFGDAVVAPVTDTCIGDGEYAELATSLVAAPIVNTEAALESLTHLDDQHVQVLLEQELETLQQTLAGPSVTVCVLIAGDDTAQFIAAQMDGVTGVAAGTGRVILLIDPETVTDGALRYTLAHEYHHQWWTSHQAPLEEFTLLDYLVFEGRADAFAQLQHPNHLAPWINLLTAEQIDEQWAIIQPQLDSRDPLLLQNVMFGGGRFPQRTGYAAGNEIVTSFLAANPTSTTEDWSLMQATDLLADSNFARS